MSFAYGNMSPRQTWQPLPSDQWNTDTAAHLLRRIGFSARPADVQQAVNVGLQATVKDAFKGREFDVPTKTWEAELEIQHLRRGMRNQDEKTRQELQKKIQRAEREAFSEFAMAWFDFARQPENSAQEKYVLFLESMFVVAHSKVKRGGVLYEHQNLLRREGFGSYRDLAKSVSRSPAMIQYLDLNRSVKGTPNENFARELMELFTLGEGNYTEQDVKEAARAFTGYNYTGNTDYYFSEFRFNPHSYDDGPKTVFGRTGRWNGDEIIEMVFEQPGAKLFLPRELCLFYLSETPVPDLYLDYLGDEWAKRDFDQRWLLQTVFTSQLFFAPEFRGELIKSPIHYYIGLCQDMNLDIYPVPQRLEGQLRSMGQSFQNPPNVRGWLGGKHWITASSLSARQQLVRNLLYPPNEKRLNADEKMRIEEAIEDDKGPFHVDQERLEPLLNKDSPDLINHLCRYFLPKEQTEEFKEQLIVHVRVPPRQRSERVRQALLALLQSPAYQLS
ncbi:DUF1800 domain-containing protein [Cerasicoccus arenae]|uniref:DUF1800 domain-containing protein n=1 Tax=Cerasicoccus arenae TaxID=424488 RepID=A0A8J3DIU4_9BACT|nr:DUF1800 domain-containing protein [Cerasicoccus arenae]MBK1857417.1 DUF1800 domain-containing protein [Cerasicoccus arenae]GHC07845.1 hypothetical protein GCM10007047_26310 [Cerasicoccus arenae]